jgi:hypothetical protein
MMMTIKHSPKDDDKCRVSLSNEHRSPQYPKNDEHTRICANLPNALSIRPVPSPQGKPSRAVSDEGHPSRNAVARLTAQPALPVWPWSRTLLHRAAKGRAGGQDPVANGGVPAHEMSSAKRG